jgi:hypothetical protein
MQMSVQRSSGFFVGQVGEFRGADYRGAITYHGEIRRMEILDYQLFAVVQVEKIIDKHKGLVRFDGLDVVKRIQLTGPLVDILNGRPAEQLPLVAV